MKTGLIPLGKNLAAGQGIPDGVAIRVRPIPDPNAPSSVSGIGGYAKASISPWTGRQIFLLTTPNDQTLFYLASASVIPFPTNSDRTGRRGWNAAIALTSIGANKDNPVPPNTGPQPSIYWEVWDERDEEQGLIPWGDPGLSIDVGGAALVAPGRRWRTLYDSAHSPFNTSGALGCSPLIDCGDCQDSLQLYIDTSITNVSAGDTASVVEAFPLNSTNGTVPVGPSPLIGPCPLDGTGPGGSAALIGQIGRGSNASGLHAGVETSNASPPPFVTIITNNVNTAARVVLLGR